MPESVKNASDNDNTNKHNNGQLLTGPITLLQEIDIETNGKRRQNTQGNGLAKLKNYINRLPPPTRFDWAVFFFWLGVTTGLLVAIFFFWYLGKW
jgi:hypothetical protein